MIPGVKVFGPGRHPHEYPRGSASYTLTMSPAANELWEDLQKESGGTRDDVLRKALGLLKLAYDARREGKHVGFSRDSGALETEIEL